MDHFTRREALADLLSPASESIAPVAGKVFTRKVRLDSKGRLLLPIDVRRSFGLDSGGAEVRLCFSLERNEIRIILNLNGEGGDL